MVQPPNRRLATEAYVGSAVDEAKSRATHTGTQTADTITDGTTNKAYTAAEKTKLAGVATGATANSSDAALKDRANHTGTQSADTVTDGTTNKAYTATEKTKLAGVATGATANATDATLKARANHTGTQTASTISDFATAVQALTGGAIEAGDGITVTTSAGKVTISLGAVLAAVALSGMFGDLGGVPNFPEIVRHNGITDPVRPPTSRPVIWDVPDNNRPATNGNTTGGSYAAVDNLDYIWTH